MTLICRTVNSRCSRCATKDTVPSSIDSSSWRTIQGQFISIIGANITCRCAKSLDGISPNAHLGDGVFDLILIRKTSRLQHLRHMMRIANRGDLVSVINFLIIMRNGAAFSGHGQGWYPFCRQTACFIL